MGLIKYLHRMGHTTKKHSVYIQSITFECQRADRHPDFASVEIKFVRGSVCGKMLSNSTTLMDDNTKIHHFLEQSYQGSHSFYLTADKAIPKELEITVTGIGEDGERYSHGVHSINLSEYMGKEKTVVANMEHQSKLEFHLVVTQGKYVPQDGQPSTSTLHAVAASAGDSFSFLKSDSALSAEEDSSVLDSLEYSRHLKGLESLMKKQMLAKNQNYF